MTKTTYTPSPSEVLSNECAALARKAGITPEQVRKYIDGYMREFGASQWDVLNSIHINTAFGVPVPWDRYDVSQ